MEQKAPDELRIRQRHVFPYVAVGIVFPGEGNRVIGNGDDTVVAHGNSMRVPAEIFKDRLWPGKGRLCIDYPLGLIQGIDKRFQCRGIFIVLQRACIFIVWSRWHVLLFKAGPLFLSTPEGFREGITIESAGAYVT